MLIIQTPMRFGVFHCHFHSLNFRPLLPTAILGAWFAYVSLKTRSLNLGFLWMKHVGKKGRLVILCMCGILYDSIQMHQIEYESKRVCVYECIYILLYNYYVFFSNEWCIYAARVDRDQPVPHGQRRLHIYTYNPRESPRPGISNICNFFSCFPVAQMGCGDGKSLRTTAILLHQFWNGGHLLLVAVLTQVGVSSRTLPSKSLQRVVAGCCKWNHIWIVGRSLARPKIQLLWMFGIPKLKLQNPHTETRYSDIPCQRYIKVFVWDFHSKNTKHVSSSGVDCNPGWEGGSNPVASSASTKGFWTWPYLATHEGRPPYHQLESTHSAHGGPEPEKRLRSVVESNSDRSLLFILSFFLAGIITDVITTTSCSFLLVWFCFLYALWLLLFSVIHILIVLLSLTTFHF